MEIKKTIEEKPATEDLTTKARTVTILEQVEAQAKLAYDGELYWAACLLLQAAWKICNDAGIADKDHNFSEATDLCIVLEDLAGESGYFIYKRFDCLTATSCPDVWK